jgi:hypothetical protein
MALVSMSTVAVMYTKDAKNAHMSHHGTYTTFGLHQCGSDR